MATFKRCDRCSFEIEQPQFLGLDLNPSGWVFITKEPNKYELCDKCMSEFDEWFLALKKVGDGSKLKDAGAG